MTTSNMPGHDAVFRALIADPARAEALIRHVLPKIRFADIRRCEDSFVDGEGRTGWADALFRARLSDRREGDPQLYVLLEHKSEPDSHTPTQLLRYILGIFETRWASEGRFPGVIPVVVYRGQREWKVPRSVRQPESGLPPEVVDPFRYVLFDLRERDVERLPSQPRALSAGLLAMKFASARYIEDDVLDHIIASLEGSGSLEQLVLQYIMDRINPSRERLEASLDRTRPKERERIMGSMVQEFMAKGMAQGIDKGRTDMLMEMANLKFRSVPGELERRIRTATGSEQKALMKRILFAEKPDDLSTGT